MYKKYSSFFVTSSSYATSILPAGDQVIVNAPSLVRVAYQGLPTCTTHARTATGTHAAPASCTEVEGVDFANPMKYLKKDGYFDVTSPYLQVERQNMTIFFQIFDCSTIKCTVAGMYRYKLADAAAAAAAAASAAAAAAAAANPNPQATRHQSFLKERPRYCKCTISCTGSVPRTANMYNTCSYRYRYTCSTCIVYGSRRS